MKKQVEPRQIKCPECGAEFEVETILRETIEKELRQKLTLEIRDRLTTDLKQDLQQELTAQLAQEKAKLETATAKLQAKLNAEAEQNAQELLEERERAKVLEEKLAEQRKERKTLLDAKAELDELKEQMERQISQVRQEAIAQTKQTMEQELEAQLSRQVLAEREKLALENEQIQTKLKAEAAQTAEALQRERENAQLLAASLEEQRKERKELLKAKIELDNLKGELEEQILEVRQQAIAETKQTLRQQFQEQFSQQLQSAIAEKDIALAEAKEKEQQLKDQIEALKQRADQGSMQIQGEAFEAVIEETLRNLFPRDQIKEIETGAYGADLTQIVVNDFGSATGKIIYESKKAKHWQDKWIQKLRQDAVSEKADLKIIVTTAMPDNMDSFGQIEDVFVCRYHELPVVSTLLRQILIQAHQEKRTQEHMKTVQERVVDYIRSDEFKTVMTMLQEAYHAFSEDLRKEENYMKQRWKARRDYLDKISNGLTSIIGSLAAIGGTNFDLTEQLTDSTPPKFLLL
ncbi:DUF2130 domain-containing protein [Spirulina subsalsa]|uniref:DUF2130 domain-containing protein n=1 Tax=Spirulina subsalsa TaxID=54311 RepID=UPI0002F593FB|nr:DUF2130 domain-containing protein [Spirulina subsalsa]